MKIKNLMLICFLLFTSVAYAVESMPLNENFKISHSNNNNVPQIGLIHNVIIEHKNESGKLLGTYEYKNLITSAGKAGVASRINGSGAEPVFQYLAIGTNSVAAADRKSVV